MRTTVDLPPAVHRRAREIARRCGLSLSAVVAELTARGLIQLDEPAEIVTDERSGFPVVSIGRRVTVDEVAAALDEDSLLATLDGELAQERPDGTLLVP